MSKFYETLTEIQQRKRELYPEIEPYNTGMLKVSEIHTLYYEECGNKNGKAIVFAPGGPGGGAPPNCRRFFNPEKYHIILFDQRGSGRSTPHACVEENTTWDLVADMEKLRLHLGFNQISLAGGSWGSTLCLTYAISHPDVVVDIILRGIFLLRPCELKFFYERGGAGMIHAEAWQQYEEFIPENERDSLIAAYNKRLFGDDEKVKLEAAKRWSIWEGQTSNIVIPDLATVTSKFGDEKFALAFARIENHYFNAKPFPGMFDTPNWILENCDKIKHIPTFVVHGRYDSVCCYNSAYELKKKLPNCEFHVAPLSGHSSMDPDITVHLLNASDKFAEQK